MRTVALAICCKTPTSGLSKTRLSPPLRPDECAAISACFIRDLSATIAEAEREGGVTGYALYTPRGSEASLLQLLPEGTKLMPQVEGDFGERLLNGAIDLLATRHSGAILINSDLPTLPKLILRRAADAVLSGDNCVLSRAADGGYTLIGCRNPIRVCLRIFPGALVMFSASPSSVRKRSACPLLKCPAGMTWMTPPRWACSRPSLPASARPSR